MERKDGSTRMTALRRLLSRITALYRPGDKGAAALEYGLLVSLIAAVIIVAVFLVGTKLNASYNCSASSLPSGSTVGTPAC
jgi:pilus assembly protein Flp/PilA